MVLTHWSTESHKPQYAEQQEQLERTSNSSQSTARPESPQLVHAVASNSRTDGVATPVLLRDHIHATDPATPPRSDDDLARSTENDLNFDLQELGLEDFTIKPEHLVKLEKIGSGGFKEYVLAVGLLLTVQCLCWQASWPQGGNFRVSKPSQ